jgi:phosphoglucomutase
MAISPLAGKPAPASLLVDLAALERAYYERAPESPVSFGTSGHRGSSLSGSFTERHILCITQAICEYRAGQGIDGPLFMGKDTHALSGPAQRTALEVLAANGVTAMIARDDGFTTAAARSIWATASSSPRRTTRRRTAVSNITRRTAARPTPM